MSLTDAVIHNPVQQNVEPTDQGLISLNEVFKESMKKAQECFALPDLFVRCDAMPITWGNKETVSHFFDQLLGIIFRSKPNGTKLFLYLDCEIEASETEQFIRQGFRKYYLKFHTNLTTDLIWKKVHEQAIARSREIISTHNWLFVVNNINHTGCLFSITVPGKFE